MTLPTILLYNIVNFVQSYGTNMYNVVRSDRMMLSTKKLYHIRSKHKQGRTKEAEMNSDTGTINFTR